MVTAASHEAEVLPSEISWDEPPLGQAMLRETASFYRRSASKRWLGLGLAVFFGAAVGVLSWKIRPSVAGWVVLRVVENKDQAGERPRTNAELRQYLSGAVFSRQALAEALKAEPEWSDRAAKLTPEQIDDIRENIEIEIYGNTFIEERRPGEAPRSMRLTLGWTAADGDQAQKMADLLARLVTKAEVERVKENDRRALASTQIAVEEAQRLVDRLIGERRTLEQMAPPPPGAALALTRQINVAQEQLARYRSSLVSNTMAHRAEAEEPWRFTVLDRRSPLPHRSVISRAIISAIATTVGCYPVLLLLMGAFSWRLSQPFEAEELGFAVLGTIPGHSASFSAPEKDAEDLNG